MVSITTLLALAIVIGFFAFGGIPITKTAFEKAKEIKEDVKAETQKRIDQIRSDET